MPRSGQSQAVGEDDDDDGCGRDTYDIYSFFSICAG